VRRPTAVILTVLGVCGCWRSLPPGASGVVEVVPPGPGAVRLTYLGVGGWIFERGTDQILAAPLFSNPSFVRAGLGSIRSDSLAVDAGLDRYRVSDAAAILVGHAHYDHLMDVPHTARRHAPAATILGSSTVRNTLGSWSGLADRVLTIDSLAGDVEHPGTWIRLGRGLRVMALRSHHAPHFDGYTLYQGKRDRPLDREPRWATEWLDGPSYAFLVDFLDPDGGVAFRIYYQDAVAAAPRGFAPAEEIAIRPVDVAILVPATFDQVEWHPEAFIENLRPRWVLLGHWENFFVPPAARTRSIPLSDLGHFQSRLARVFEGTSWLPEIGTEFVFPSR